MTTTVQRSSGGFRFGVAALGLLLGIAGIAGVIAASGLLRFYLDAGIHAQVFYEAIWVVCFASLAVAGISLIVAAVRGRQRDLVPGPTLYLLGASLMVNGMWLLVTGNAVFAAAALVVGALVLYTEYHMDIT